MALDVPYIAAWLLVATSVVVSLLYAVRVLRKSSDPLRWALLALLLSLAATNLAPLLFFRTNPPSMPPEWIGAVSRVGATVVLLAAVWPLLRDTWREACAWVRVGLDSWKMLTRRGR